MPKGTKNGSSKLKENDILEIRRLYVPFKYSSLKLAKQFKVSKATILFIVKNKTWKHI